MSVSRAFQPGDGPAARIPFANRLEALKGNRKGQGSIPINGQWRLRFVWNDGSAERVEMAPHAIDALDPDTALADARAADARRRKGRRSSPLDGVPVFAKSIYDMRGLPTTASSAEWAQAFPEPVPRDALEVARLRAGGAIVLGKTAADDFAYRGNGMNRFFPTGIG